MAQHNQVLLVRIAIIVSIPHSTSSLQSTRQRGLCTIKVWALPTYNPS